MPKGLYFTAVVSFFFFFLSFFSTPNLWGLSTDLNQTWTKIYLWLLFEKFGPNSSGIYPPPHGRFLADFELWRNIISATEHDINNRKETCQSTGTPLHAPKFGERWYRNGWERLASFCPPTKFSHWETLPALLHGRCIIDSRQTLARVM